jgi:plasmid stabilization system protein ParE
MRVRLSENARAYLIRETAYLRKLNPAAARNLSRQMRNAQRNLAAFDGIGFESEELPIRGMRRLVVGDYLMDYEVVGNEIHVLAIRHGRQLPPDVPLDDDYDFEAD